MYSFLLFFLVQLVFLVCVIHFLFLSQTYFFPKGFDTINSQLKFCQIANESYLKGTTQTSQKKIIESKHPYPAGKYQMKEVVTIKGAKALSIFFDTKCCTCQPGDILEIIPSTKKDSMMTFFGKKEKKFLKEKKIAKELNFLKKGMTSRSR